MPVAAGSPAADPSRRMIAPFPLIADTPPMNPDIIGWPASAILLATLSRQIVTQRKAKDTKGVSRWLFLGQMAAAAGLIAYRWPLDNRVFIVTNSLILLAAVVGEFGLLVRRRGAAT